MRQMLASVSKTYVINCRQILLRSFFQKKKKHAACNSKYTGNKIEWEIQERKKEKDGTTKITGLFVPIVGFHQSYDEN